MCPYCGSTNVVLKDGTDGKTYFECQSCDKRFDED